MPAFLVHGGRRGRAARELTDKYVIASLAGRIPQLFNGTDECLVMERAKDDDAFIIKLLTANPPRRGMSREQLWDYAARLMTDGAVPMFLHNRAGLGLLSVELEKRRVLQQEEVMGVLRLVPLDRSIPEAIKKLWGRRG